MTDYFHGGEMPSFVPSSTGGTEFTSLGYFDSSFCRCAIKAGSSAANYLESTVFSSDLDTFYTHFDLRRTDTSDTERTAISWFDGSTELARLRATDGALQMQALISAAWTNVGDPVTWNGSLTLENMDVYIDGNDANGTMTLFLAGTQLASGTADLSAVTAIDRLRIHGPNHAFSQLIVSDEPTIGRKLLTRYPSGAGSDTAWTGDYTGVDEIVRSDADFINSSTANQVETFAQTGAGISGYIPLEVSVYARAKRGASGPANLQLALRSSGTNYFSGNKALGVGYAAYGHHWATDPATAAAWLSGAIDTLQPGVKSIT